MNLTQTVDFEPYSAFKRIDRFRTGCISPFDLKELMRDNGVFITEQEALTAIRQYDADGFGSLSVGAFTRFTLPSTTPLLRNIATTRRSYHVGYYELLPYPTESALVSLVESEIRFGRLVDEAKRTLSERADYSLTECFRSLDRLSLRRVDREDLREFSRVHGSPLLERDIDAVIRRVDTNADERLSYFEFAEFMEPLRVPRKEQPAPTASLREFTPRVEKTNSLEQRPLDRSYQTPQQQKTVRSLYEKHSASVPRSARAAERGSGKAKSLEASPADMRSTAAGSFSSPNKSTPHATDPLLEEPQKAARGPRERNSTKKKLATYFDPLPEEDEEKEDSGAEAADARARGTEEFRTPEKTAAPASRARERSQRVSVLGWIIEACRCHLCGR